MSRAEQGRDGQQGLAARFRSGALPATGVITGSSAAGTLASLKKIDGVYGVEEDMAAALPPRGSKQQ